MFDRSAMANSRTDGISCAAPLRILFVFGARSAGLKHEGI